MLFLSGISLCYFLLYSLYAIFFFYISMLLVMLYTLYAMIYADHSLCQW